MYTGGCCPVTVPDIYSADQLFMKLCVQGSHGVYVVLCSL